MRRHLYTQLLEWKNSSSRKPLILEGARQVGKTWLLDEFGTNEYKYYIKINCDNNPEVKDLFSFQYEDFQLTDYNPHPHIPGIVAV